jgi:hypothetical protein
MYKPKQKFSLEVELPENWNLSTETFIKMVERDTILKVKRAEKI